MQADAESLGDARLIPFPEEKTSRQQSAVAGQYACNWTDDRRDMKKGTVAFRIGSNGIVVCICSRCLFCCAEAL